MRNLPGWFARSVLNAALALLLVLAPMAAQGQTQSEPVPPPATAQDTLQPQAQPPNAQGPAPIPQQKNPEVKPGSKADVEAIGNRDVGGGLNFYSL